MDEEKKYTYTIDEQLNHVGIDHILSEKGDKKVISVAINGKQCAGYNVRMIISNESSVTYVCYVARNVKKSNRAEVLEILNDINYKSRYFKYIIDTDGDIRAEYDTMLCGEESEAGSNMLILFMLFSEFVDNNFNRIMTAVMRTSFEDENENEENTKNSSSNFLKFFEEMYKNQKEQTENENEEEINYPDDEDNEDGSEDDKE